MSSQYSNRNGYVEHIHAAQAHYCQTLSIPSGRPKKVDSLEIKGVGYWQGETNDEGSYPVRLDIGEGITADATSSAGQGYVSPPLPLNTTIRPGVFGRHPYAVKFPQQFPPTSTRSNTQGGPNADDFDQDSSNGSYYTADEYAEPPHDHHSPDSHTTHDQGGDSGALEGSDDRIAGHYYTPSRYTPSQYSRESRESSYQPTGQYVQQPVPPSRIPQKPFPFSEWDRYDAHYAQDATRGYHKQRHKQCHDQEKED